MPINPYDLEAVHRAAKRARESEYPRDAVRTAYQRGVDAERARLLARVREIKAELGDSRINSAMAICRELLREAVSGPSDTPATPQE